MMGRNKKLCLYGFGLIGVFLLINPVLNQAENQNVDVQDPQEKVLQYDAQVVIKLVSVRVLDPEGHPVTNLRREDFVLYDNDEKKVITEFEIHTMTDLGMKVMSSSASAPKTEIRLGMNRRFFIFLDIQGRDVNGMANAKETALHFVDTQLRPEDEVGIFAFSPMSGFKIQEYLTTDHDKIRKAIQKTKELPPSRGHYSGAAPSGGQVSKAERFLTAEGSLIWVPGTNAFQKRDFVPRMADLALALKNVSGNKSLVLFTSRFLGPAATQLGKAFAEANTPVYTINTRNWIVQGIMKLRIKKKRIWTNHALQGMAAASGGKYFADIEDIETISQDIQLHSGNFYVLGYYVTESWDGKYHQLKVEVKDRPDLTIMVQDGYFNPKPYSQLTDFEKQLNLVDLVYSENPSALAVTEIPIEPLFVSAGKETFCLFLSCLTLDKRMGIPPGKVEVSLFLFDENNKTVLAKQRQVDFSAYDRRFLYPYITAKLPSAAYECRIVTRDALTGQAAVGRTNVYVPRVKTSEIMLSSPLLFIRGEEYSFMRLSDEGSKTEATITNFYRFLPRNHRPIVRDIESGARKILAVQPVIFCGGHPLELELDVWLHPRINGGSINLDARLVDVKRVDSKKEFIMIEIDLPSLNSGEYELEVKAIAIDTKAQFSVRKLLVVV